MAPHKVVVKCGSYAVLVDLQIIGPLGHGAPQETSWFTMEHTEEVTSLVRDAVDRRVRLYIDCLHKRGQPKHKRELPRANPLCVKGQRVSLVANFVKRHFNLWCIVKHQYGELRVFPERYVVCVSRLEDASANPTPAVTVSTESQYFSRPAAETRDELNSSAITKRSSLQKIARHANARPQPETQPLPCGSVLGKKLHSEQNRVPGEQVPEPQPPTGQARLTTDAVLPHGHPTTSTDPTEQAGVVGGVGLTEGKQRESVGLPGDTDPRDTVLGLSQSQGGEDKPSRVPGEDPPRAKRVCLGPLLVACSSNDLITPTHSAESSNPLLPPPPPPLLSSPRPPVVKSSAKTESEAFPAPAPALFPAPAAALFPAPERTQSTAPLSPLPAPVPERTQSTAPLSPLPAPVPERTQSTAPLSPLPAPEKDQSTAPLSPLPAPAPERTQSTAPLSPLPAPAPEKDQSTAPLSPLPAPAPERTQSTAPLSPLPAPAPEKDQSTAPLSPLPAPVPERTQSTAPLSPLPAPERTQSTAPLSPLPAPVPERTQSTAPLSPLPAPERTQSTAPLSPLPAPERTQSTAPLSPLPAPERTQSQTSQTTVEVELLTPGKQSQSLLPLTSSNNTEQTNQNSPAAGLRGRSVKDVVSSALSIASTHIGVIGEGEEGRENGGRRRRRGEEKRREGRGREEKRAKIMEGKRGEEREYNGGDKSRRGEEREVGEEERSVARPSRLRRLKK
ncbi:protein SLX4IP isoform X2 [Oncorhynchus mykiss]|uniref:protein SLX4IP isoform X2 n=1 Tax=Oncorhynchus mykiss TaxID=8022 RepID=UPI00187853A5|nr:protein SLX4IP isoform X2 [Oncorhynchus mykiss]